MPDENAPPPETPKPEAEGPKWEQRTNFRINSQMTEVIHLALSASEAELKVLRRKLDKLQYGS
jgi:hypothetical protein